MAVAGLLAIWHQPAAAEQPSADRPAIGAGALSIRITGLAPAIPDPGDELVVTGTITNVSPDPVSDVSAVLRVSPTPVVNRDEIPEVLAGAGQRTGVPVPGSEQEVASTLGAGQSAAFTLRADIGDLRLAGPGAYVTGAEALGDSGAGRTRQDLERTFLPWWPQDTAVEPVLLTTIWPLTGAPLRDAEGVLLTEDTAVQMSPAGRMDRLLAAGAADPGAVSLVIDPEAVHAAAELADGYQVRSPDGTVEAGTRRSEVAAWLEALQAAVSAPGADVSASLYAWPDVDAARGGKLLTTILRQRPRIDDTTAQILGRPLPSSVALAPGGVAKPETLGVLADAGLSAVVLSDQAVPLVDPTYFTPSGNVVLSTPRGEIPALLLDSGLSATLARPMGTPAEQTSVRQALLADTLVTAVELPETQRLLITGPDPSWSPPAEAAEMVRTALTDAPWVTPTSLAAALSREPSSLARRPTVPSAEQVAQELPGAHVTQVRDQYRALAAYAEVVSDPAVIPEVTRTAPTRLLDAWFRDNAGARADLTGVVTAQVDGLLGSVAVVSSGSITVSGASGTIPITIENSGPAEVTVGLELTSTPPQLFSAEPVEPFTIAPERRTSVEVTAQVAAAGPIPVSVQLVTSGGQAFGTPTVLVVESAAYANAARVLVQLALGALVLAVVVHGLRRARRRRRTRAQGADGDDPGAPEPGNPRARSTTTAGPPDAPRPGVPGG